MNTKTIEEFGDKINSSYGINKVVMHPDLLNGIKENIVPAIKAAEKNTMTYKFDKNGYVEHGSFADMLNKYNPK